MSGRVKDERAAATMLERAALRRMVQPKNRDKGTWRGMSVRELVELARVELDEVVAALDAEESPERVDEELGDVAAFIAMAVQNNGGAPCCCIDEPHVDHCLGWSVEEFGRVVRCARCALFATDAEVEEYFDEGAA